MNIDGVGYCSVADLPDLHAQCNWWIWYMRTRLKYQEVDVRTSGHWRLRSTLRRLMTKNGIDWNKREYNERPTSSSNLSKPPP